MFKNLLPVALTLAIVCGLSAFAGGSGISASPYQVSNATELSSMQIIQMLL